MKVLKKRVLLVEAFLFFLAGFPCIKWYLAVVKDNRYPLHRNYINAQLLHILRYNYTRKDILITKVG